MSATSAPLDAQSIEGADLLQRLAALDPATWSSDREWDKRSDTIKATLSDGLRVRIDVKHIGRSIVPDYISYVLLVNGQEVYAEKVANTPEACFTYRLVSTPLSEIYRRWFHLVRMPAIQAELDANPEYQAALASLGGALGKE